MIVGVLQADGKDTSKVYDYMGFPYPEGYLGETSTIFFERDIILDVVHIGYSNQKREEFIKLLKLLENEDQK